MSLYFSTTKQRLVKRIPLYQFTVFEKGKAAFNGPVYARSDEGEVTAKGISGVSETFENCVIEEVDVQLEHLILKAAKKQGSHRSRELYLGFEISLY